MNDIERAAKFIDSHKWQFAKTMQSIPHSYCVRAWYSGKDADEFNWFDNLIHQEGEVGHFGSRPFRYFYLNGKKYWDCGDQRTIENLINRDEYKKEFKDEPLMMDIFSQMSVPDENNEVISMLQQFNFRSVVNPYCGVGRAYDLVTALKGKDNIQYYGVDTRVSQLRICKDEKQMRRLFYDKPSHCFFGEVDLVFTLEAERLSAYDLRRIEHMNGVALLFSREPIDLQAVDRYRITKGWKQARLEHWNLLTR